MTDVLAILERASRKMTRLQKDEATRKIEDTLTKKMSSIFSRQGNLFLGELSKFRRSFDEAIRPDDWKGAWKKTADETSRTATVAVEAANTAAWKAGAGKFVADLGIDQSFSLPNPRAVAFLKEHAAKMVSNIDDTTEGYIRTLMTRAVDEGWSYDRTAKMLSDRFTQFAVGSPLQHIDSRAHLVATTEAAFGYEHANASIAGDLGEAGLPMMKSWLTVYDDRVDTEDCLPNEKEGWIPADQDFQDGSSEPPAHPGCRCSALYQVDPDFLGPLPEVVQTDTGVQVNVGMT